jgi:hypothetical protein
VPRLAGPGPCLKAGLPPATHLRGYCNLSAAELTQARLEGRRLSAGHVAAAQSCALRYSIIR